MSVIDLIELRVPCKMANVSMRPPAFVSAKRPSLIKASAVPKFELLSYFNYLWIASYGRFLYMRVSASAYANRYLTMYLTS